MPTHRKIFVGASTFRKKRLPQRDGARQSRFRSSGIRRTLFAERARPNFAMRLPPTSASSGQAAIIAALFLLAISLVIGAGFASVASRSIQSSRSAANVLRSYLSAESGVEDVVFRIANAMEVDTSETLTVGGEVATTEIVPDDGDSIITGSAAIALLEQSVGARIFGGPGVEYSYGVQVGEGGFCMDSGAMILSDVYTSGGVLGPGGGGCDRSPHSGSATITGNAVVSDGYNDDPDDDTDGTSGAEYYDGTQIFGQTSPTVDLAQKFRMDASGPAGRLWIFLRKVGNPEPLGVKIVRSVSGLPSTNVSDILASTTVAVDDVLTFYTFVDVRFATSSALSGNTDYWFVLDVAAADASNYYEVGKVNDSSSNQKYTTDSSQSGATWSNVSGGDFSYRIWRNAIHHEIDDVIVTASAWAYSIDDSDIGNDAFANDLDDTEVADDVHADSISDCEIGGDAYYNTEDDCLVSGTRVTPTAPPSPPPYEPLSLIPPVQLEAWHTEAVAGGSAVCDDGEYEPADGSTIGPLYIPCDLIIGNGDTITIGGTLWVSGNVIANNGAILELASSYGELSGAVIGERPLGVDEHTHIDLEPGVIVCGSEGYNDAISDCNESNGSYLHFVYLNEPLNTSIHIENNVEGRAVFYDPHGRIKIHNNAAVAAVVVGYQFHIYENASLEFETELETIGFISGPPGALIIKDWRRI